MSSLRALKGFFIFIVGYLAVEMQALALGQGCRFLFRALVFIPFCLAWPLGGCLSEFFSKRMLPVRELFSQPNKAA